MRLMLIALLALMLAACATPYEPKGDSVFAVRGYSHTQLGVDTFDVYFVGKDNEEERSRDFVLLRTAQLCLSHQFTHFTVLEQSADVPGAVGGGGISTGVILSGGHHGSVTPVISTGVNNGRDSNHHVRYRVKCANASQAEGVVYDAPYIQQSVAGKYGIIL